MIPATLTLSAPENHDKIFVGVKDRIEARALGQRLAAELRAAQENFQIATRRTSEITAQVPSGIPAPDSNLRITLAAKNRLRAYESLQLALKRWKEFTSTGETPELSVSCPTCGAKPAEPCELSTGVARNFPHRERRWQATDEVAGGENRPLPRELRDHKKKIKE